jgi:hypothetical protein
MTRKIDFEALHFSFNKKDTTKAMDIIYTTLNKNDVTYVMSKK